MMLYDAVEINFIYGDCTSIIGNAVLLPADPDWSLLKLPMLYLSPNATWCVKHCCGHQINSSCDEQATCINK